MFCLLLYRPLEQKVQLHPSMRSKMAAAMSGSKLYVFGGLGAGPVSEMWVFDMKAMRWNPIRPEGATPPARCGHSFATDNEGRIWLFGGQAGSKEKVDIKKEGVSSMRVRMLDRRNVFSDSWMFDPNGAGGKGVWEEQRITGISPSPRRGHSATMVTIPKRVQRQRENMASNSSMNGSVNGDDVSVNSNVGGISPTPEPVETSRVKRRNTANDRFLPQEMFVIGGAGPDPGKGFETVHGQLWIFNTKRRDWCQAECKGLPPDSWARFEHTASLVSGGMQGASAGDTLVVVGGVSASTVDSSNLLNQSGSLGNGGLEGMSDGVTYSWGGPESRILALAVDTLVWTQLTTAVPSNIVSSFASHFSEDVVTPAPSLHGHGTVINPYDPRELLVFGGRGEKAWSNELYSLTLPPPHIPGTPYPGMPKKKFNKNKMSSNSSSTLVSPNSAMMSTTQGLTTKLNGDEGDQDPAGIPEPIAEWESLGTMSDGTNLPARYGHCLASWLPPSLIKERDRLRNDSEGGKVSRRGASSKRSTVRPNNGENSVGADKTSLNGGDGMPVSTDFSPKNAGILLFGGSLCGGNDNTPTGYANSDVHFLDLGSLQLPGELRRMVKAKRENNSQNKSMGSVDGSVARSNQMSMEGSQLSQSQVILAKLVLDAGVNGGGDCLPAGYSDMKRLLLGQREDHRTSKLKRGDKSRTTTPSFALSGMMATGGTGMASTMLGSGTQTMGRSMGGTGANTKPSTAPSIGSDYGLGSTSRNNRTSPLSSANSTMSYLKLRRLANYDVRFAPTPLDIGRSTLMKEILTETVFPPVQSGEARHPQTSEEIYARKHIRPKTAKELFHEKWAVPGIHELINPQPKPVITISEARRRFRTVTRDPTNGGR